MSLTLVELANALKEEVSWLHLRWHDFRALYGTDAARIELLNKAAPDFFGNLQRAMFEGVLLHICRITDRPVIAGHATLTIQRIPEQCHSPELKDKLEALIKIALEKVGFAREWRNRILAHKELPLPAGAPANPLPLASRQSVEEALKVIRDVMNAVHFHLESSMVGYEHAIPAIGGVDLLLHHLRKGVEAREDELGSRSR